MYVPMSADLLMAVSNNCELNYKRMRDLFSLFGIGYSLFVRSHPPPLLLYAVYKSGGWLIMTEWMDSCVWNVSLSSIYLSRRMRGYWHVHQVLWMMQTKENRIDNNADDPTGMRPDMHYCLFAWSHGKKRNCGHCCAQYKRTSSALFPFRSQASGHFSLASPLPGVPGMIRYIIMSLISVKFEYLNPVQV